MAGETWWSRNKDKAKEAVGWLWDVFTGGEDPIIQAGRESETGTSTFARLDVRTLNLVLVVLAGVIVYKVVSD